MNKYLIAFFTSMTPISELRGAMIYAIHADIHPLVALVICVAGNIIPVPFIYFFARKFLTWGADKRYIGKLCGFFLRKGESAGKKLTAKTGRGGLLLALALFVGIPLPVTGAWTGTLGASFLDTGFKSTVLAVFLGLILSGTIMAVISILGLHVFGL